MWSSSFATTAKTSSDKARSESMLRLMTSPPGCSSRHKAPLIEYRTDPENVIRMIKNPLLKIGEWTDRPGHKTRSPPTTSPPPPCLIKTMKRKSIKTVKQEHQDPQSNAEPTQRPVKRVQVASDEDLLEIAANLDKRDQELRRQPCALRPSRNYWLTCFRIY